MTELVARHTTGARMTLRGTFESRTWPLRKLAWKLEEKVVWRLVDAVRGPVQVPVENDYAPVQTELTAPAPSPPEVTATAAEVAAPGRPAAPAPPEPPALRGPRRRPRPSVPRPRIPSVPRPRASARDVSIALATVAVAVGGGIAVATMLGSDGDEGSAPSAAQAPASPAPQAAPGPAPAAQPDTLQGVAPNFEGAGADAAKGASSAQAEQAQVSPTADTNSKPSAIPPGAEQNGSAMNNARDFAGAFVLYEVGKSDGKVRRAFNRTATPTLAKALADRPPRLPDSVQVPTAKVQNVVLGAPTGRRMEASVSLLRLGDISELRLTLTRRKGEWLVSEVRG